MDGLICFPWEPCFPLPGTGQDSKVLERVALAGGTSGGGWGTQGLSSGLVSRVFPSPGQPFAAKRISVMRRVGAGVSVQGDGASPGPGPRPPELLPLPAPRWALLPPLLLSMSLALSLGSHCNPLAAFEFLLSFLFSNMILKSPKNSPWRREEGAK